MVGKASFAGSRVVLFWFFLEVEFVWQRTTFLVFVLQGEMIGTEKLRVPSSSLMLFIVLSTTSFELVVTDVHCWALINFDNM